MRAIFPVSELKHMCNGDWRLTYIASTPESKDGIITGPPESMVRLRLIG
jgi:hypothetical protein